MTLLAFIAACFGLAGLAISLRDRPRWVTAVGLVGLGAAVALALQIDPRETVVLGDRGLATGGYLRLFLILGSLAGLGLALAGVAAGTRRDAPAVTLAVLAAAALTMGLVDPGAAVLVATAGGLFGVLVTLSASDGRVGATIGIRETRAVVVAGALAIGATAWFARDISQFAGQPVVFGLAYLAFAVAVAMRFGAIPFHLWAARLTDVVPETALPVLTVLAPASLAVVALAWIGGTVAPIGRELGPERLVIIAIAIASIGLASIAAFVQDDIEHVLGYSIVGDAGVVVLALATLSPEAWAPARIWILSFVVTRSAFAAWTAGIRTGFSTGRVLDLHGWARRSPILAIALVVIAVATVGFPGLAAFDARASLIDLTLEGFLSLPIRVAVLLPVLYYARLLLIGLAAPPRVGEPVEPWRPRVSAPRSREIRGWFVATWGHNRAFTTASMAAILGLLALLTASGGLGVPAAAAGRPPLVVIPVELIEPGPSAGPSPTDDPPAP